MEYKIERGSVWWANLPKDELNTHCQYGRRPVVVISNNICNDCSPCIIVCPITTKQDKYTSIHPYVTVKGDSQSYVLCEQPRTIDKSVLEQYQRKLTRAEMDHVDRALMVSLGLSYYTDKLNELKCKLYDATESQSSSSVVQNEDDKTSLAIGEHVKAILKLIKSEVDQTSDDNKGSSLVSSELSAIEGEVSDADKCDTTMSHSADGAHHSNQLIPHKRPSAIDKFNARLAKSNAIKEAKAAECKETQLAENISVLGRASATKWTDSVIRHFVNDFETCTIEYILSEYRINSESTAKKYYSKYRKLVHDFNH